MFPLNPLEVLASPSKFGLKAVGMALLLLIPFVLYYAFTMFAASRNQKISTEGMNKDRETLETKSAKSSDDWQKNAAVVDTERDTKKDSS